MDVLEIIALIILFLALCSYIAITSLILYNTRGEELDDDKFRDQFGIMIEDLNLFRHPWVKY